jgi:hypothetical protein
LGEILKAYTKEVMRQTPHNIFEFSAQYFAQLEKNEEEEEKEKGASCILFLISHQPD